MKTKIFILSIFFSIILGNSVVYCFRNPIQIATSNLKGATYYTNNRFIARTSDDRLVVIYTDKFDSQYQIYWTYSDHGFSWAPPQLLADGDNCGLTIDENDNIYLIYTNDENVIFFSVLENGKNMWNEPINAKTIDGDIIKGEVSAIEVSDSNLILLYLNNGLYYHSFALPSLCPTSNAELITTKPTGKFSIAADIRFKKGPIHIMWASGDLYYCNINNNSGSNWNLSFDPVSINGFTIRYWSHDFYEFISPKRPSMSVDNDNHNGNEYYISYAFGDENRLVTGFISANNNNASFRYFDFYETENEQIFPCVDDVVNIDQSCALVWNGDVDKNIYYAQMEAAYLGTLPPIPVSDDNDSYKSHPNVCYRTFRADYFDVIWTEGNAPPYKVMFRRMGKRSNRLPQNLTIEKKSFYYIPYQKYWNVSSIAAGGKHPYNWEVLSGFLPPGLTIEEEDCIKGTPTKSGNYNCLVKVTDSTIPADSDSKNFYFNIINHAPEITSPDTVYVKIDSLLQYQPTADDMEENSIQWHFSEYPVWMTADSSRIQGIVPSDFEDASFIITASDGELADTLRVYVKLFNSTSVDGNSGIPLKFTLYQNYPNPFNPATIIKYRLAKANKVTLKIFNLCGQEEETLVDDFQSAGEHTLYWQPKNLTSGLYFYRLYAGEFSATKKLILLK